MVLEEVEDRKPVERAARKHLVDSLDKSFGNVEARRPTGRDRRRGMLESDRVGPCLPQKRQVFAAPTADFDDFLAGEREPLDEPRGTAARGTPRISSDSPAAG